MPDIVGQTLLSRYRLEAFVAHTALGALYRVADTWHNKPLALTILPKSVSHNPESLKQLETNSQRLRAVSHPALVPYLGMFQTAHHAFLLEEWVDGPSLRAILPHAPVTVSEALVYVKSICAALEALHKQSFLHLAITPELIRINKNGNIFLSGVGAARPIHSRGFLHAGYAHWLYAAPEQFNAEPLTTAADTYALAVMLYELTTGAWINGRAAPKTLESIRRHHLETVPPPPVGLNPIIPDNFSRMTLWALRKKPNDRLKNTTELLSSLALAAGVNADAIPGTARGSPASRVTAQILSEWEYLPPPAASIIEEDRPPLEKRLAASTPASGKKNKPRLRFLPMLGFGLLAGIASLFFFIRPAPPQQIITPVYLTPFIPAQFTPPPTITSTPKPTYAPGNRIAFTCTRGYYNQICLINEDGTGLKQITDTHAGNYYPVFNPQGGSLLFASNRNGTFDLYLYSLTDSQTTQITDHFGNIVSPDFSPDGSKIVFANLAEDSTSSIWIVNSDGLNPRLIYTGLNTIVGTAWSPDGGTIAYAMSRGVYNEYEIFLMDADGKNNRQISRGMLGIGGSIDWSPDSKYLLVYAGPVGDKDIFRIEVETGKAVQLTDGGNNAAAEYSPDGKYIAFNSLRNDNQADIYIMNADGTEERQLTDDPEPDWGPVWEP